MVVTSSSIAPWQGGRSDQGFAHRTRALPLSIGTEEQVHVECVSNPVLSAAKQVTGRRNVLFRT